MAQTEREQVLGPADQIDENVSQVASATVPIGGTMHGDIEDLTVNGTGFYGVPVNLTLPAITGTAQEGETLTCVPGTWAAEENAPILTTTYQWYNEGVLIADADAITYEAVAGDVGDTLTCIETVTNVSGSASAESAPTEIVIAA